MRTSFVTLFGLAATVAAIPARVMERQTTLCSSGTAQCCSVDVLGVADLDCANPPTLPANGTDFANICAAEGQIDMCCLIPILDQGLLCQVPIGG
ncbi:Cryparin [Lachnellula subtilissima]|uniref:Cryparin n=1 Tax=Lachnellula subtilissima TaxID=602034 RepID=A0A8H8U7I1_9HELO|nr:Cryparin [Lachnellula subtilissima]